MVLRNDLRPGVVVRLRDPEGRRCEGIIHHLNTFHQPYIVPTDAVHGEPFYAHAGDIEEVVGFRPELVRVRVRPGHIYRRGSHLLGRRHKAH